ncbi:shikimate dehydrogenase family protein [Parvicella tangerina]|uniref:Shikimate dehydrogenase (NADP(+)) n=1 Tax=Parvicella tangerina TaxID=2829795 RepID=A0A916NBZ3_9FLAO|nr:shikimate dehydrogenase [Parvicella tangerina]CAG5081975.1 Shikimate dehydrogenase (NADP(+)) [Parvicella tangerina]
MKTFGLIGKKLTHSFSQKYFTDKFERLKLAEHQYVNFELSSIEELPELIKSQRPTGLNVTIPYKEEVIQFVDQLSQEASEVNAVNTLKINYLSDDIEIIGHNTDVFGFRQSIKPFFEGRHEKALILGTGGASKAVEYVLKKLGVEVTLVSRQPKQGQLSYEEINEYVIKFHQMIVNTTPVGMYPHSDEKVDISYDALTNGHLLIDLIYNPEETQFLKEGKARGAKTLNGLSMLHQQAEKAWEIWNE